MTVLSAEHRAQFDRDGYLVLRSMFDRAMVADLDCWTTELLDAPEVPGRHMVYGEPSLVDGRTRLVQRIENFCPFHARFDALLDGPLRDAAGQLFGESAVMFKDKINFKMPGGGGFEPHQDQQAGWTRYASVFITVLVAVDDATVENGCLEIAAGQHRCGMLGAEWQPLRVEEMTGFQLAPLPTRAGDAVFFDSYVPHASQPNLSLRPRRASM